SLWILQTQWTRDASGFPFRHCQSIEVDYQSGPERPHSKSYADLIYTHLYAGLKSILKGAPIMIERKGLLLAALTALLVSAVALGQTTTATLSGVVKDASGALVPDVKVTARNAATGATRDTKTDSSGVAPGRENTGGGAFKEPDTGVGSAAAPRLT